MRNSPRRQIEHGRVTTGVMASQRTDGCDGAFNVDGPCGTPLTILASYGLGWDHVSVSCVERCPTWEEMAWVKRQFWRDDEAAIEYHPPKHLYVNRHPFCLHLWRPQGVELPVPPMDLVG